ncbi:MAG TPA: hypothetical protein VJ622_06905 [Acidimicrobiia bacterium]|nr:hypothetical protein [Acidimicrobiia bacterium]
MTQPDGTEPGRRLLVIASPGDRRDEDMRELGRVAARYFDEVIVREDYATRGRPRGESAQRVYDGIQAAMGADGRAKAAEIIVDELQAVDAALARSKPGDFVVLCVDKPAVVWKHLEGRRAQSIS